jgi:hypothetical protein
MVNSGRGGHYLILSGAISNAGDFLIRERALALLGRLRPDRELVVHDRWTALNPDDAAVRDAAAIVLAGGPALQRGMYPGIWD